MIAASAVLHRAYFFGQMARLVMATRSIRHRRSRGLHVLASISAASRGLRPASLAILAAVVWFTYFRELHFTYVTMGIRGLSAAEERALKPGDSFKECAFGCPEMVVVPPGTFVMGSGDGKTPVAMLDGSQGEILPEEAGRDQDEGPPHEVRIPAPFAVGKFEVTFDECDVCVAARVCPGQVTAGFLIVAVFACLIPQFAQAKRVALIIANGDYQHLSKLPNPVNGASQSCSKCTLAVVTPSLENSNSNRSLMMPVMRMMSVVLVGLCLSGHTALAQLTQPEPQIVPHEVVASYKPGTFLESIVIAPDGTLFIADHEEGRVLRRTPAGDESVFAKVDGRLTGLALDADVTLHATGSGPDHAITLIYSFAADGKPVSRFKVEGAQFLNGMTPFKPGVFLVADSQAGVVWLVEPQAQMASVWLAHDLLKPRGADSQIPAANGVKIWGGAAYISNSDRAQVIRIAIGPDGNPEGNPEVWADGVVVDDFAFDVWGTLYGTTHIFNSVIRIGQDGSRATIAGPEHGVVGSTAVAFGRTDADRGDLYVVGDGGLFKPLDGKVQEAKLTRLSIGAPGAVQTNAPAQVARPNVFLARCVTAEGSGDVRKRVGPDYLRYLQLHYGRIALGGQLFDDGKTDPSAPLYFLTAASAAEARALVEGSPYFTAGLYSKCEVNPFTIMLGQLIGGLTWPPATQAN